MGESIRNVRGDRLDIQFRDYNFVEVLKKWKLLCNSLEGGQTSRIMKLIEDDIKKLKTDVLNNLEKI